jgi:class 3 adenylate cyclase
MSEESVQRRLAAILAADVVGYSRLVEQDEVGTLTALETRRRDVLKPLVTKHLAQLEGPAEPGGICTSQAVPDHTRGIIDLAFEDLGKFYFKNLDEPLQAYRVRFVPGSIALSIRQCAGAAGGQ